ncbi:MAG: FMN-binding negative transcriptional regulator [Nitratireductor sp.]|nr:FMN-binding negative transcriptional regulator [Nitratireductor sp.]
MTGFVVEAPALCYHGIATTQEANSPMHPNPAFRKTPGERNLAFARDRGFGILAVNAEHGPLLSHIPFVLSQDGSSLEAHLVRSNPIVRLLAEPEKVVIAVSGADGYVSPDWYGMENQVPTWNYVAVHLRGVMRLSPQEALHGVLTRLSAGMESRLLPKKPWTSHKMDQDIYERMQRQIVPVAMSIETVEGTWKLSQNKPDAARLGAARGMHAAAMDTASLGLAALMQEASAGE